MEVTNSETNNSLVDLSRRMAEAVERVSPSIVAVDARPRVPTSGVIWRPGIVVSTNHTIRRDEEITVSPGDGRQAKAMLVGRDAGTDIAVLRVGEGDSEAAQIPAQYADASTLKVGNLALAVGRASAERGVTASLGIISVVANKWRTWRGGEIDRLIRPDTSIFIGFSGGALVDVEGKVIGINTTGLARGAGVTIPASTVDRVIDQLLRHGRIARPYLGVGMQPVALPDKLRSELSLPATSGLVILSVEQDAPADKAGITLGDVVVALDGQPVADTDDIQTALGGREIGQTMKATILRGGELREVTITLGEKPGKSK